VERGRLGLGVVGALAAGFAAGCATIVTQPADLARAPEGVRVYPPQVCFLVDTRANDGEGSTVIAYLPDFDRAYDVRPLTVLARQELRIELEQGRLAALTSSQDTSPLLSLLGKTAELAAAGVGVSTSAPLRGRFGFGDGVHCLRDDGSFAGATGP
jgi:hypothetical protein